MTKYQKYKLGLILLLGLLLSAVLYSFSLNGRYLFKNDSFFILDTRTGTVYSLKYKNYISIDNFNEIDNKKIKK